MKLHIFYPHPGRSAELAAEALSGQSLCGNVIPESRGILNLQVVSNKRFLASLEMTNTAWDINIAQSLKDEGDISPVMMNRATSEKTLIIVPAYNEEKAIVGVVENIRSNVPDADILVVNDGSLDRTARKAREKGAYVISLPYNMGIGSAVQSGFLFAKEKGYNYAVQVDGDGQHPPSEIPKLLAVLDSGVDVAIGSRFVEPTAYRPQFFRALGIKIFSHLVSALVGQKVYDTTSGFRAHNRQAILLLTETFPHDYPEVEALITLHRLGMRFAEVPVEMNYRKAGRSSIRARHAVYYMLKVTLAVFIAMSKRRQ